MKFPNLPAANSLTGLEIVPLTQGGVDRRSTVQDLANLAAPLAFNVVYQPNSSSPITADNVQDAIDEIAAGGVVAGADKQIQFNNSGTFGGEAGFEYDFTANTLTVSNITAAGLVLTTASTTGGAGFRLPHGAAPITPVNGDVWTTSGEGLYTRINGVTIGPLGTSASSWGSITGTLSSQTDLQAALNAKAPLTAPFRSVSTATTTVAGDANGFIFHLASDTAARVWTIDSNANVAYPVGTAITFENDIGAGELTISIMSDTLVLVSVGTTGSRTLAVGGRATALKVGSTRWRISGIGLT